MESILVIFNPRLNILCIKEITCGFVAHASFVCKINFNFVDKAARCIPAAKTYFNFKHIS